MEVRYKREMKRNYLIVEPDAGDRPGYEARMLLNNAVEGLLRFHIKYMDERQSYYYDITSMQPLARILQNRFIERGEICQLLIQIHVALRRMEEYLLSEDGLLLEPDYIYVDPEGFRTGLCLVPGMAGSFPDRLSRLLQYLMKKVDHRDKECVVLAYGLYQESLKENFSIEDLMRLVQREGRAGERTDGAGAGQVGDQRRELWANEEGLTEGSADGDEESGEFESRWKPAGTALKQQEKEAGDEAVKAYGDVSSILRLGLRQLAVIGLISAGAPGAMWFLRGASAVRRFQILWLVLPLSSLILTALFDVVYVVFRRPGNTETCQDFNEKSLQQRWEIPLEDPEPAEPVRPQEPAAEEPFQTTLLTGRTEVGPGRRLEAKEERIEDIAIPYFPFIIGKHEDLVDYVLNRSTVSRLHVRIDREGEEYRATDLNSTNGTMVGGHLLEANETVKISIGDEICIADLYFTFR